MYKKLFRPLFFLFQAETIHRVVFIFVKVIFRIPGVSKGVGKSYSIKSPLLKRTVFGIDFPSPVGLAAGFDKDARLIDEVAVFGFGFIEIGTVTPLPQSGNPRPRMFRLLKDEAIINRMGFNNDGMVRIAERLRKRNPRIVVGGNIGKNKVTSNELAIHDFEKCFRALYEVVDYFVVNVSSPNTEGLRELQEKEPLKRILNRLQEINLELSRKDNHLKCADPGSTKIIHKPLLLKIAPDLTNEQLDAIIGIVLESKLDGVVATNTTVSRTDLKTAESELVTIGPGGLSGKPLGVRSTEIIRYLSERSQGKFSIIGVGGIHSPDDAVEKIKAGASLVQIYTGFVYEGPGLIKKINKALINLSG